MTFSTKTTWVVVADEAIARILVRSDADGVLEPVEELTHPDAHAHNADLRHDALGQRTGGSPPASGHGNQPSRRGASSATASAGEDEKHLEAEKFAREIAAWLLTAWQQKRYAELHIVAAPRLLGLLRKFMSPQVAGTLKQQLSKDWVHMSNDDITGRLFGSSAS